MHTISPADFNPVTRPVALDTACWSLRGDLSRTARQTGPVLRGVDPRAGDPRIGVDPRAGVYVTAAVRMTPPVR